MPAISPALRRVLLRALAPIGFVAVALAVLVNAGVVDLDGRRTAVPFPILAYEIEAVSDGHTATLLNLPIPNVGVPQAPIPVDVDGDLLPDVEVGVNLVNAEGLFNNPPQLGEFIAPNIEINRLVTASLLGQGTPPLKINVKLTVVDLEGTQPDTVVRFGYDTGEGGSIPPSYKAVLGGLDDFFNPLTARIDTTGGLLNLIDPGVSDLGLTPAGAAYRGPLTTFAGIDNGPDLQADIDLEFSPMPQAIEVSYGSEETTQSITYAHDSDGEVDLTADADLSIDGQDIDTTARIDRLPSAMAIDIGQGADGAGFVDYDSAARDGRLPDVAVDLRMTEDGERPINARLDLESLPSQLSGAWNVADEQTSASFTGSGQGIGALEARITNYDGDPVDFDEWIPSERQHVNLQAGAGGILEGDTYVSARMERIRSAEFAMAPDGGVAGVIEVGDGERPLELHGALDFRDADLVAVEATTRIAPLPDRIALEYSPPGADQIADPTRIVYEASESIDVDLDLALALAGTSGPLACGAGGTTCADLELRHVPDRIEARLVGLEEESRVEVDAVPRAGGAPLDLRATAIIGPLDVDVPVGVLAAPVKAEIDVQDLPEYLRVRTVSGASETLERLEFHTCDQDYDLGTCAPGTQTPIGQIDFTVSNFSERPENLPGPSVLEPLFVSVVGRGLDDTNEVLLFEAAGRITDVDEFEYVNVEDLLGVNADVGNNEDFRAYVDIDDVDLDGEDAGEGRVDIDADVAISPLPAPFSFCTAGNGRPLVSEPYDDITAPCENADPFDDDSVETGPLTVAYRAPSPFDVEASFALEGDLPFETPDVGIDFETFERVAAQVSLEDVPGEFTAYVHTPAEPEATIDGLDRTSTRVRTVAPGADDLVVDLAAQLTSAGVDCDDPDPSGSAVCAQVVVDGLPEYASVIQTTSTDPDEGDAVVDQGVEFAACDLDIVSLDCRPGTEGEIGSIDVDVRVHAGDPDGVDPYVPPADTPHLVAMLDLDDLANFEAVASVRVEGLRGMGFTQDPEGIDAHTDLGDGVEPLLVHAVADLRDTEDLVDDALRARIDADVSVTPLPERFSLSQTGPGENQDDPVHVVVDTSSVVDLVASAEIREIGAGPDCGDTGTVCAAIEIDDIPEHVEMTLDRVIGDIDGTSRETFTSVDLDLDHADGTSGSPDVRVDAAIGLPVDTPLVGETPLFADLDLTGVPADLFIVMDGTERLASNGPDLEVAATEIDRLLFITCEYDLGAEACEPGTEDAIDLVEASVRTFDLRPTDFPAPPADTTPLYVGVTGRGEDVEAQLRIPEISTVQYIDRDGVTAVEAALGGTTPSQDRDLQVRVDVEDIVLADEIEIGDLAVDDPTLDVDLTVDVTPFPGELTFCTRSGGQSPVPTPSGLALSEICEDQLPFGPGTPIGHTPLSIGFTSNVPFDVRAELDAVLEGDDAETGDPIDQQHIRGVVDVDDLPTELRAHFLQPTQTTVATPDGPVVEQSGPFRGVIDAPGAGSGVDLDFEAAYLVGENTVCEDPRVNVTAFCVAGGITDLPTHVDLFYDPELDLNAPGIDFDDPDDVTNLIVSTDGPTPTTFETLEFSSVSPQRDEDGALVDPPAADILIATAELDDLPHPLEIRGTLDLPDDSEDPPTALFDVQDGKSLPGMRVHIRNYIAPDPTIDAFVPDRPVQANALDTYEITAFQRGDAFRLDADIIGVRGGGIRSVRDLDGNPIGTDAIRVDFAEDFNVRAFADLQPEAGNHILIDALLEDIPAGIDVCVRKPREGGQVGQTAIDGTWCDSDDVADDEGALEIATRPTVGDRRLDVDAFARLEFGGGASVLAGRVDIDEIPQVLRIMLPTDSSEDVEFAAFSPNGVGGALVPDGIDKIAFQAASFDLAQADTGYVGDLPYDEVANGGGVFPAAAGPGDGSEFLHAAVDLVENDFHAIGQIGRTDGQPSSQLQRVRIAGSGCEAPENDPPDYPAFPEDDRSSYTCVRADFAEGTDGVNPLSLHAEAQMEDGVVVRLHEAGISNVPAWIQFTLGDTDKYHDEANERGWRRPCGTAADEAAAAGAGVEPDCMAPMLRFDQPDETYLFGLVDYGTEDDITAAASFTPDALAPDFDSVPTGTGWDGQFEDNSGIRVKVVDFDNNTPFVFDDDRLTAHAALRLPIPQSLTVDHPQTFNQDDTTLASDGTPVDGDKASDFRFRSAIRDSDGVAVDQVGELAAMFAFADSDAQVLLTQPCAADVVDMAASGRDADCPDFTHGVPIPGEIALGVYLRDSYRDIGDDKIRGSSLIQAEGRVSTPVSIGARLIANGLEVTDGIKLGNIEVAIRNLPAFDPQNDDGYTPSFRLRTEIINDGELKEEDPIFSFVSEVDINVQEVFAGFDFSPTDVDARRVDAVVYLAGTKIGVDIAGYDAISGGNPAAISAGFAAKLDPLDLDVKSVIDFPDVSDTIETWLTDELGLPSFIGKIVGWLADKVLSALEDFLNKFPIVVELESSLLAQFTLNQVETFSYRSNLLHVEASETGPLGSFAQIGPINLDMDVFNAGLKFQDSWDIPGWLDWLPGVPDEIEINILLAGIEYDPLKAAVGDFISAGLPGNAGAEIIDNIYIEFRPCTLLSYFFPVVGSSFNQIRVDGSEEFVMWPGTDPRIELDGVLFKLLGIDKLDFLLDYLAGPIFCEGFKIEAGEYESMNNTTAVQADYNPGNEAVAAFAGHPVPGQPSNPAELDPNGIDPTGSPLPTGNPPAPSPGPAGPPEPPAPTPPRYSGAVQAVNAPVALCGVHEFDALTISSAVTVATAPAGGNPLGTGAACPAGSEGTLELRANTIVITGAGSIDADAVSSSVPVFDPDLPPDVDLSEYAATGNSGGTNAGVGFTGSFGDEGIRPYGSRNVEPETQPGSPGSAHDVNSAGPAGLGGGAIVLRADDALVVSGSISANGGNGAGDLSGACDADPDDNGTPGLQTNDDDGDPMTPEVDNDLEDPPYEHTGVIGSGGGAGGGIVFEAREFIDLSGSTVSAIGGNGGNGRLGAGGGGGGGVVKVLAPDQDGTGGLATAVVAGLNGADGGCDDVPQTANPVDEDGIAPDGDEWETDGEVVIDHPPFAEFTPYGGFWWGGGAGQSGPIRGWIEGAGGPNDVTVVTCAARLPTTAGAPSAGGLVDLFQLPGVTGYDGAGEPIITGTLPTAANPCGSRPGSDIVELDDDHVFNGAVAPEDADAEVQFTTSTSGYYGLYTTALRPNTPGNDCTNPSDGGIDDAVDCAVEKINGVEWVIGVDATRPTVSIVAPAAGDGFVDAVVYLDIEVADQDDLSGLHFVECMVTGDTDWRLCGDEVALPLTGGNGPNTIQVRAYDLTGNVSLTATRIVHLDQDAPEATATLSPTSANGNGGWYTTAPTITISGYDADIDPADRPYVYKFDNGFESNCPVDTTAPYTCVVSSAEVDQLSTGEHTFRYSAVNEEGVRYKDDNNSDTPSPMPSIDFKLDTAAPTIALATVPTDADQSFGGNDWFDVRPFLVLSAIDQVGGSGLESLQYRLGGGAWTEYDPLDPPIAPNGTTLVSYRAFDVAGNVTSAFSETVRVDADAPTLSLAAAAPTGDDGWYVTTPVLTAGSYDDGAGVGADSDRVRYRIDNGGYVNCDPDCDVVPGLDTGRHLVHASAVDRFGNRSGEETLSLAVDLEAPETDLRLSPSGVDGANGWRLERPFVELVSVDPGNGSGVAATTYSLDGAPVQTYSGPFLLAPGSHSLCVGSVDVAGNVEPVSCSIVEVDIDDPDAEIDAPAVPGTGFHLAGIVVNAIGSDPTPGSGVDQGHDPILDDLCDAGRRDQNPLAPSGQCVSVDGSPFVPVTGAISLGEGEHSVRTFTVDVAGRRSAVVEETRTIDESAPAVEMRTLPPLPARNGWWRAEPVVVLRAVDGDQGSGIETLEYRVDGGPWTDYDGPFTVGEGDHVVEHRATDRAGRVTQSSDALPVDLSPPTIETRTPAPKIWSRLFGPNKARLRWTVAENLADEVEITVIVHDLTGNVVRTLDGGTHVVTPGVPLDGETLWDGKNRTLTGLVPVGVYFYRVVAIDEAGNVAHSGESAPIQIRLL